MSGKFPDADEDEDIIMTRMFVGEQAADKTEKSEFEEFSEPFGKIESEANLLEIPELEARISSVSEAQDFAAEPVNLDPLVEPPAVEPVESADFTEQETQPENSQNFTEAENEPVENETVRTDEKTPHSADFLASSQYQSETSDETIRKSGLAYAAAIILFGSIVFTLILGWFADLLLGTSPWGKVGGIILGAIIGFIQFFRTTSQILKDKE